MARKARQTESPVTPTDVVVKLRLSAETVQQLRVEALGRRVSLSALIEELFRSVPRRYVLQERTPRPPAETVPGPKLVVGPHVAESA